MARRSSGEGSIYRRKSDGNWAGSIQIGGKRFTVYGDTRKEAAEKLQAIKEQQAVGILIKPSRLTVEEYLRQWLESARLSRKPSTIHGYEDVVRRQLTPTLGNAKLQKLAPQHLVRLYSEKLSEGLSARRVQIIHAVLHTALEEAVRFRLVSGNVASQVRPPRQEREEPQAWSVEEVRAFVEACEGSKEPYAPALLLTLGLGLRLAELSGLTWDRVNMEQATVRIDRTCAWVGSEIVWGSPKSRAGQRLLPLTSATLRALTRLRVRQAEARLRMGQEFQNTEDRVVTSRTGGVPTALRIGRALARICHQAGVPRAHLHQLRHNTASILIGSGVDLKSVQHFMGHSRASTTIDIYSHLVMRQQKVCAEALERTGLG